jgi:hypothetical protein
MEFDLKVRFLGHAGRKITLALEKILTGTANGLVRRHAERAGKVCIRVSIYRQHRLPPAVLQIAYQQPGNSSFSSAALSGNCNDFAQ